MSGGFSFGKICPLERVKQLQRAPASALTVGKSATTSTSGDKPLILVAHCGKMLGGE
jgi:hypothetical protein